jgi:hypothetical protein
MIQPALVGYDEADAVSAYGVGELAQPALVGYKRKPRQANTASGGGLFGQNKLRRKIVATRWRRHRILFSSHLHQHRNGVRQGLTEPSKRSTGLGTARSAPSQRAHVRRSTPTSAAAAAWVIPNRKRHAMICFRRHGSSTKGPRTARTVPSQNWVRLTVRFSSGSGHFALQRPLHECGDQGRALRLIRHAIPYLAVVPLLRRPGGNDPAAHSRARLASSRTFFACFVRMRDVSRSCWGVGIPAHYQMTCVNARLRSPQIGHHLIRPPTVLHRRLSR